MMMIMWRLVWKNAFLCVCVAFEVRFVLFCFPLKTTRSVIVIKDVYITHSVHARGELDGRHKAGYDADNEALYIKNAFVFF